VTVSSRTRKKPLLAGGHPHMARIAWALMMRQENFRAMPAAA
jgi:hypothetical protein